MTPNQLRQKYIDFFVKRDHKHIPSAPLVPPGDSTTLFTGSGMQPILPYLLGEKHSLGTRLVDSQKCFRAVDIEEVGDNRHTTFFEMLGNWSFGDYFKEKQIPWYFEFLTKDLGLDPQKLYITVFRGRDDLNIPKDSEAVKIWQEVYKKIGIDAKAIDFPEKKGMQGGRIFYYSDEDNWWSRAGVPDNMPVGEPGGPSSEVFYDIGTDHDLHENSNFKNKPCHVNCDCGRFLEIGNSVFMTYKKTDKGFIPLKEKNIDFGGGFERTLAAVGNNPDVFTTQLFTPIIQSLEKISSKSYQDKNHQPAFRIVSDHIKGAVMLAADGVYPGNKEQSYFSRRLIRRAILQGKNLGIDKPFIGELVPIVSDIYQQPYPEVKKQLDSIKDIINQEELKFRKTLDRGLKEFKKLAADKTITGKEAFYLYETFGFPVELIFEMAEDQGLKFNIDIKMKEFAAAKTAHAKKSRTASAGMFKGGLADHSETTIKYHTATHLIHKALRNVLGDHVRQEGSNITADRLRFDFAHSKALTPEELKKVEKEVNQKIKEDFQVTKNIQDRDQALKSGALAFFKETYPDRVSVYTIGDPDNFYSKEFCGGPHVSSTGQIGPVKITKEQSIGAGKRRIYAVLV